MAKREAHARSELPRETMPATLSTAAEEHAQALRLQLLESTELAAKKIVGQTRAEGERRIEVAGRQAQAIAETVAAVERAEQALAERAKAFGEASRALRSELKAFAETLSESEARLAPRATEEPELRLVEAPPEKPQPEAELEDEDEDDDEQEPDAEAEPDAEDGEPPTPEQIARYFREAEEAELARAARPEQAAKAERIPKRDRLYTDIGGAVIGLGGAAALINFVLLK